MPEKITIAIFIVSLGLSGYAAYSANDRDLSNRITVVETQQRNDKDRLERIEDKLDKLLDLVRKP